MQLDSGAALPRVTGLFSPLLCAPKAVLQEDVASGAEQFQSMPVEQPLKTLVKPVSVCGTPNSCCQSGRPARLRPCSTRCSPSSVQIRSPFPRLQGALRGWSCPRPGGHRTTSRWEPRPRHPRRSRPRPGPQPQRGSQTAAESAPGVGARKGRVVCSGVGRQAVDSSASARALVLQRLVFAPPFC